MAEISKHKRVNDHLLKPVEVPFLNWAVRHTPAWFNSDMYTGLGVFGAVVIFLGYWLSRFHPGYLWLASFGFVIHWVGDSLDGSLARYRNRQRPIYGFFIDHTTDTFTMLLVFIGIGLSEYVKLSTALLVLVAYLCMSIMVYLRTCVEDVFEITFGKVGPTEMRLVAIIINTGLFFFGNPQITLGKGIGRVTVLDAVGYAISIILIITFAVATIKNGIVYARQDSLRLQDKAAPKAPQPKAKRGR